MKKLWASASLNFTNWNLRTLTRCKLSELTRTLRLRTQKLVLMESEESSLHNFYSQILKVKKWARIPNEVPCLPRYQIINMSQRIIQFALQAVRAKRDIQAPKDKNPKLKKTLRDPTQESSQDLRTPDPILVLVSLMRHTPPTTPKY